MRLSEINGDDLTWVDDAAQRIYADCQPFLNQSGNSIRNALYRGVRSPKTVGNFNKIQCPVDRKPATTTLRIHQASDNWMDNNFGIRYRSNALFVTGNLGQADEYGTVYMVFPIGEFRFCYSKKVYDMIDLWPHDNVISKMSDSEINSMVSQQLAAANYQATDLVAAIKSNAEIMMHCPSFYLIKVSEYRMSIQNKLQQMLS